ncbi:MAG TPA: hypothetical protein VHC19_08915 [Pirellulales bacterium]|nr:hypothetical protein [Pirellulales bacterium]
MSRRRKEKQTTASSPPAPVNSAEAAPAESGDRLWLAAFLLLAFLVGIVEVEDPDIWWHLRTGQLIVERGEIPRTDWFTYTNPESPWIDLHWTFQLCVAALWALGGSPAWVLAKSFCGAAAFGVAMSVKRTQGTWRQAVACWLPSLLMFSGRNQVRPEMFSFLFLAASLAIVFSAQRHPRRVWALPLIELAWVNAHGLFVLGFVVWGCFLADAAVRWLRRAKAGVEAPSGADWRRWAGVTLGMVLASLANPYGYRGALFPFVLLQRIQGEQRAFYQQFAGEFDGLPEFLSRYGLLAALTNVTLCMTLVLLALGAVSFIRLWRRGSWDALRALLFAAFAYLAWQSSRNSALFAIAGGMIVRENFGELAARSPPSPGSRGGRLALACCLGMLLASLPTNIFWALARSESPRRFGWGEVPNVFSHEAAKFLGQAGMPRRVFPVDQGEAAVYIFHNGPQRRVFADGRLEVNTPETLARYIEIRRKMINRSGNLRASLREGIEPGADGRQETPALLIDVAAAEWAGVASDPQFRPVYFDGVALVFLDVEQAERLDLPAIAIGQEILALARRRSMNQRVEND